ncbi:MAG: hypothetical protein JWO38_1139 [Gemmataceae bacterium]|nr:hypothetical protein [Gemmataceae bacterium]
MSDPALLDPPAALPPPAPDPPQGGPLANLILVRLLAAGKTPPALNFVRKQVGDLFPHPPAEERFGDAVRGLRAAGLLPPRGQRLTPAGRARALAYLGVTDLPPRCTWPVLQSRFLVPKALGLAPGSDEAGQLADGKTFVPRLLKRELRLPVGTRNTPRSVLEAIVCRELGFPDLVSVDALVEAVTSKVLGLADPLPRKKAEEILPRKLLGAKTGGTEGARRAVLGRLTAPDGPALPAAARETAAPEAEAFDLEAFAHTVAAAARTCPTGRFGEDKVFISHVWRQLHDHPQIGPLGAAGFKAKLLDTNRARLLTLSRADLVQMMDTADVRESEIGHGTGAFHFVLLGRT